MPNPTGAGDITRTITVVVPLVPAASQPLTNDSWNYVFTFNEFPFGVPNPQ